MFALRDKTRRAMCRTAFVVLCVVPTVAIAAWCAVWQLPVHRETCQQRLSAALGVDVRIGRLIHWRPGTTVLEDVQLAEPETARPLARFGRVSASRDDDTLVLDVEAADVQQSELPRLWRSLEFLLQRRGATSTPVRLAAGQVRVNSDGQVLMLTDCEASLGPGDSGPAAGAAFRLFGSRPVHLRVARDRGTMSPSTALRLDCDGAPLPCPLLATACYQWNRFGPRSHFDGSIVARSTAAHLTTGGWNIDLRGRITGVDLARLTLVEAGGTPIAGPAEIEIHAATFRDGRWESIQAAVSAGPGEVSSSALRGAAETLDAPLVASLPPDGSSAAVPYDRLAAAFLLDGRGLWIRGDCVSTNSGVVLADGRGALLRTPSAQPQPVIALARLLTPGTTETHVPATRQSAALLRHLPLPSPAPSTARHVGGQPAAEPRR